jgi:hypothetical protein
MELLKLMYDTDADFTNTFRWGPGGAPLPRVRSPPSAPSPRSPAPHAWARRGRGVAARAPS